MPMLTYETADHLASKAQELYGALHAAMELAHDIQTGAGRTLGAETVAAVHRDVVWALEDLVTKPVTSINALHRRLQSEEVEEPLVLDNPAAVANFVSPMLGAEIVRGVLHLNAQNRLIEVQELSRGSLEWTLVDAGQILRHALLHEAHSVLLFQTDASRSPQPSSDDLRFTARLCAAAELIGVKLADHLLVGSGASVSLKRRGVLHGETSSLNAGRPPRAADQDDLEPPT